MKTGFHSGKWANGYYSFGSPMPGRQFNSNQYRYGFGSQEKIDEIYGTGNYLDFTYRGYNPRLGRFFAVDPLSSKFPYYSPYQFASNSPIMAAELEGLETSKQVNENEKSSGNNSSGASSSSASANPYSVTTTDAPGAGPTQGAPASSGGGLSPNKVISSFLNATTAKITVGPQVGVDVKIAGKPALSIGGGKSKDIVGLNKGTLLSITNVADPNAPVTTTSSMGIGGFGVTATTITTVQPIQNNSTTLPNGPVIQTQSQTTVEEKTLTVAYLAAGIQASQTNTSTNSVFNGVVMPNSGASTASPKSGTGAVSATPNPLNNSKFGLAGKLFIGIELEFDAGAFLKGIK